VQIQIQIKVLFQKIFRLQIVEILPKNVFKNTKTNTLNLYEIFDLLHSELVFWCVLMFSDRFFIQVHFKIIILHQC